MTDAGDERPCGKGKDAARIPLSVLAIGFVLCAGSGIYSRSTPTPRRTGSRARPPRRSRITDQPRLGRRVREARRQRLRAIESRLEDVAFDVEQRQGRIWQLELGQQPLIPAVRLQPIARDSFKGGHYEIDGTYVYTFGSGEGSKPTTMRIPLPSEFK